MPDAARRQQHADRDADSPETRRHPAGCADAAAVDIAGVPDYVGVFISGVLSGNKGHQHETICLRDADERGIRLLCGGAADEKERGSNGAAPHYAG